MDTLVALASEATARHVLEIGAGTGNNTQPFLERYPCVLTALEPSRGMLARARAKGIPARWVQGSAVGIPLPDACAGLVFGVYVLHFFPDMARLFAECARVLGEGCAVFVTAPSSFIERHPMNDYFPSFAKVDKARFQREEDVERAMRQAGFSRTGRRRFKAPPRPIDKAYVHGVADKFISTYELLPPAEFDEGLNRLRAGVDRMGRLDVDVVWESVVVWGWKP